MKAALQKVTPRQERSVKLPNLHLVKSAPASGNLAGIKQDKTEGDAGSAACANNAASPPPLRLVRVTKRTGALSKKISLDESGQIKIDSSSCAMGRGQARTVLLDGGMAGLADLYASLKPSEAVVFSNADLGIDSREICTESDYGEQRKQNPNVICRSKRFLGAVAAPGLQLFEVDDHGLPPGMKAPTAVEMIALLDRLLPELNVTDAAQLLTHSTSSFIYQKETGVQLKGEGGKHLAMLLSDLSRAAALKNLLEIRQWANGLGHIYISRNGQQLERTVFDLSVFAPERLVFEAGAELQSGLEQRRPAPTLQEGHALDMALLPAPTLAERERAEKAKKLAKEATRGEAEIVRERYVKIESEKLVTQRGLEASEAERVIRSRVETQSIDDNDTLVFTDKNPHEEQVVAYVLDHLEEFIGRPMCDPAEPDNGPSKAMILRGPGGLPFIHSFAHGGRRFTFQRIVGQQSAADGALFHFSDLANAHRIVKAYGDGLIATALGWLVYNGQYWKRSDNSAEGLAFNLSRLVIDDPAYVALAASINGKKHKDLTEAQSAAGVQKTWTKFAASCENKAKISAALDIARTLLWREMSDMNQDPWLLNVRNGTIDLRTGVLRPHNREDLITLMAPVEYHADGKCSAFEKALPEIFGGDIEVVQFLQRYLGYCLTGVTAEQKVLIPWGDGANGKSTILGIVQKVLGPDYTGVAPPKLLEAPKSDRHPTEIADLYGKRLVVASETEEGAQLREAFLKLASGSDRLKGRFMHQDFFEFDPTHKFVLQTNHKPEVKGTDYGIWRRLLLLPFEVIFGDAAAVKAGDASRLKDKDLPDKLSCELDGILTWMVRGCTQWRDIGLAEPKTVVAATEGYREEQDRIGQFFDENYVYDSKKTIEQASVYQTYKTWTQESGYYPLGKNKFQKQFLKMTKGRVTAARSTTGPRRNVATYVGIGKAELMA